MKFAELAIEVLSAPAAAQEAARGHILRTDLFPEEVEILRSILVPWWSTERDAQVLCRYLGVLGASGGQGSAPHRRATKIAILCSRTVLPLGREPARSEAAAILDILDAWAQGQHPQIDLDDITNRAWSFYRNDALGAPLAMTATVAASATANGDGMTAASANMASVVFDVASFLTSASSPQPVFNRPEWHEAIDHHLSRMADLIRQEIPTCPMGSQAP